MKIRHFGIVLLPALLTVFLMVFVADPVFADGGPDDPTKRDAASTTNDIGDNGGGDPDNPVPLDGDSDGEYRLDGDYVLVIGQGENLDLSDGWDKMVEAYRATLVFLDSILLK